MRRVIVFVFTLTALSAAIAAEPRLTLRAGEPVIDVFDRAILRELEGVDLSLGARLGAPRAQSTAELARASPTFASLVRTVGSDVREVRADLLRHGRRLFEVTDGNVGRVIDMRWLSTPHARFNLTAVVVRIDRRDFHDRPSDSCGEIRLIYRLAYRLPPRQGRGERASRMPFNLNLVHHLPAAGDPGCVRAARAWMPPTDMVEPRAIARWLASGALNSADLPLHRVEVNAQIVRLPSGLETTFGGQAIYLLRVFEVRGSNAALVEVPLENTPDAPRISSNANLRAQLITFLRENAVAVDHGVYRLPEALLARRALSMSTYGSARVANHPFTGLIAEQDLADLPMATHRTALTARGLIERLNNGTCLGCHQANATAGFHIIGFDSGPNHPLNAVKQATSPHYHAERARRRAYISAIAEGREADTYRPLSFAPPLDWSRPGERRLGTVPVTLTCVPEEGRAHLVADQGCETGSICRVIATNDRLAVPLGQCVRQGERGLFSGHACLIGRISTAAHPIRDRFEITDRFNSPAATMSRTAYNCRPPALGVPGGIAYRQCNDDDRAFAGFRNGAVPHEICAFAGGRAFDACVATQDFARCIETVVVRGNRTTCGGDRFCREDYMCQELPPGLPHAERLPSNVGFCTPTYFLFQMRIDNHPDPMGNR